MLTSPTLRKSRIIAVLSGFIALAPLSGALAENPDDWQRHRGDPGSGWHGGNQWQGGGHWQGGWGGNQGWGGDDDWDGGGNFGFYYGGPSYYAPPPPAYYYPPPVYAQPVYPPAPYYDYAPPPTPYDSPSLGFQLDIPLQ